MNVIQLPSFTVDSTGTVIVERFGPLDHSNLIWSISNDEGGTWSPYVLQNEAFSAAEADPTAMYRIWIDDLPEGTQVRHDEIVFQLSESTAEDGVVTYTTDRIANFIAANYRTTLSIDVQDAHPWVEISRIYSSRDESYSEKVLRADGFTETGTFVPDGAGGYTQTASGIEDTADVRIWSEKFEYYNEYLQRAEDVTIYDDGRTRISSQPDNDPEVRHVEWSDETDNFAWEEIFQRYEGGRLTHKDVSFDTGVRQFSQYEVQLDGSTVANVQSEDVHNVYEWQTKTSFSVDGNLAYKETIFDEGLRQTEHRDYSDGVLFYKIVEGRDGTVRETHYDNGVVVGYEYLDQRDEYGWHSRTMEFDGTDEHRTTQFDNGLFREETVRDGTLVQVFTSDTDDVRNWEYTGSQYEDGILAENFTAFDSGKEVSKSYVNIDGEAILASQNTTIDAEKQDSFVWREVNVDFDEQGLKAERTIDYVDGRFAVETYEDGIRTARTTTDTEDAYAWYAIEEQWEDGALVSRVFTDDPIG